MRELDYLYTKSYKSLIEGCCIGVGGVPPLIPLPSSVITGGGGGLLPPEQSHRQLEVGPLVHYSGEAKETGRGPAALILFQSKEIKEPWRVYNLNMAASSCSKQVVL